MKKELRIGNLAIDEYGDVRKIVSIEKKAVEFEHKIRQYYKDIKPIPLTEEWLLKMGCKGGYFGKNNCYRFIEGKGFIELSKTGQLICIIKDEYVHTFQNLVHAFTGEELTLK